MPPFLAAAGLAGINAGLTALTNKSERKYNDKVYQRSRQDALSDYHMQNDYNHPSSQMARLREAGLNPNMVYGSGNSITPSAKIAPAENKSYSPKQMQFNPQDAMASFQNIELQKQQIDNLRAQNTVAIQEAKLKEAQTAQTSVQTAYTALNTKAGEFDLGLKSELRKNSVDYAIANLNKLNADTQYTLQNNERQNLSNAQNISESVARVLTMRIGNQATEAQKNEINQRIKVLKIDEQIKQAELNLREKGINPNDPTWMRVTAQFVDKILGDFKQTETGKQYNQLKSAMPWPFNKF